VTSFDEAVARIARDVQPLPGESVDLAEAAGRVLAEPLHARTMAPRRAVAAMDGYAVIDAATQPGAALRVIGESRAGAGFERRVAPGEAVRILTGAPMPDGADRCIMQEYAARDGDSVSFADGYGPGWHVRAAGSDFAAGALLLDAGSLLTPRAMVVAAAADRARVTVAQRPRIAIIGTGDELAPPGSAHGREDAIPESVSFGVMAMARTRGARIVSRAAGADDLSALEALAGAALDRADLVIVTGGASVGERDFAKPMFAPHGLDLLFAKVAIKPGKPVWLGRARGRWVLGLPGNPTSAMVTARLFLTPLLARLQGSTAESALRWRTLPLAAPLGATGSRDTFTRARWDDAGLTPLGNQDSGAQSALAAADCLIRCPAGQGALEPGATVSALLF
jgi:molybdopterin molybdotransferase